MSQVIEHERKDETTYSKVFPKLKEREPFIIIIRMQYGLFLYFTVKRRYMFKNYTHFLKPHSV